MRQEVRRAVTAEKEVREALRSILNDNVGPRLQALYLAEAAVQLGTIQEALTEIHAIVAHNMDISDDDLLEKLERMFGADKAGEEVYIED